MTVNTNGAATGIVFDPIKNTEAPPTDHDLIVAIHASQLRTEALVNAFIASMESNPMMKMMGGMMGKKGK